MGTVQALAEGLGALEEVPDEVAHPVGPLPVHPMSRVGQVLNTTKGLQDAELCEFERQVAVTLAPDDERWRVEVAEAQVSEALIFPPQGAVVIQRRRESSWLWEGMLRNLLDVCLRWPKSFVDELKVVCLEHGFG